MPLRKVRAAIKRWEVPRQHELPRGAHLVAKAGLDRPAPTHQEVSDAGDLGVADKKRVGLDKRLRAARGGPAVIGDSAGDGRRLAGHHQGAGWCVRVGRRELSAADAKQGGHERKGEHGGADCKGQRQAWNGEGDGDGAEPRLRRRDDHGNRQSN